jgi:hypothetical protein
VECVVLHIMCFCACHWDREQSLVSFSGADVTEPVEAAVACESCRDSHCLALLPMRLANDPEPEVREKVDWVDPAQPPGDDGN